MLASLSALLGALGWWRLVQVGILFGWRSIYAHRLGRPFRDRNEALTYEQLRPVLILDDILQGSLRMSPDESRKVLGAVTGVAGAQFIQSNFDAPPPSTWLALSADERRTTVERITARFFNMKSTIVEDEKSAVAFDVAFCDFAKLCGERQQRAHVVGDVRMLPEEFFGVAARSRGFDAAVEKFFDAEVGRVSHCLHPPESAAGSAVRETGARERPRASGR